MLKARLLEAKMKDKNNSIVIFSKDRAAQLDLCLNSIFENLKSILKKSPINYKKYTTSSRLDCLSMGNSNITFSPEQPFYIRYPI